MSGKGRAGGFSPARISLTTQEWQDLTLFFKKLLAENPLIKAAIIFAGVGGLLDTLHVLWLAAKYLGLPGR